MFRRLKLGERAVCVCVCVYHNVTYVPTSQQVLSGFEYSSISPLLSCGGSAKMAQIWRGCRIFFPLTWRNLGPRDFSSSQSTIPGTGTGIGHNL